MGWHASWTSSSTASATRSLSADDLSERVNGFVEVHGVAVAVLVGLVGDRQSCLAVVCDELVGVCGWWAGDGGVEPVLTGILVRFEGSAVRGGCGSEAHRRGRSRSCSRLRGRVGGVASRAGSGWRGWFRRRRPSGYGG